MVHGKYNYQNDKVWEAVDSFWEYWDKYIKREVKDEDEK